MNYNPKIKGKEKILHAAVKTLRGYVVIGKSHADCFWAGKNMGLEMSPISADQGFVTNKGRYVDRATAAKIAKRAGQLVNTKDVKIKNITHLCSEDIWYQRERYIYCSMRGYVEVKL